MRGAFPIALTLLGKALAASIEFVGRRDGGDPDGGVSPIGWDTEGVWPDDEGWSPKNKHPRYFTLMVDHRLNITDLLIGGTGIAKDLPLLNSHPPLSGLFQGSTGQVVKGQTQKSPTFNGNPTFNGAPSFKVGGGLRQAGGPAQAGDPAQFGGPAQAAPVNVAGAPGANGGNSQAGTAKGVGVGVGAGTPPGGIGAHIGGGGGGKRDLEVRQSPNDRHGDQTDQDQGSWTDHEDDIKHLCVRLIDGVAVATPYNPWKDEKCPAFFVDDDLECYTANHHPFQLYIDAKTGQLRYCKRGRVPKWGAIPINFYQTGDNPNKRYNYWNTLAPSCFTWPSTEKISLIWYICPETSTGNYEIYTYYFTGQNTVNYQGCIPVSLAALNYNPSDKDHHGSDTDDHHGGHGWDHDGGDQGWS